MIQPNELRIGSLVKLNYEEYHDLEEDGILNDKNNIFEIRKIDNDGDIEIYNEIENLYEFQHNENIEPIPLTEEWLLNFGFELTNDEGDVKYYDFINNSDYSIVFDHSEIALHYNTKNGYYCIMYDDDKLKHVHQLQNLYFCLVGKELTQQTNN